MINQSSTVVTDAAAFFGVTGLAYPQYNTGIGDVLVIGGNFNGSGKSQLGVDAFLAGPNNSSSDLMIVTGATSGKTGIVVNDLNGGPGAFNSGASRWLPWSPATPKRATSSSIRRPATTTPKFGGVIDKGLFFYSHQVKKDPFFNTATASRITASTTSSWARRTANCSSSARRRQVRRTSGTKLRVCGWSALLTCVTSCGRVVAACRPAPVRICRSTRRLLSLLCLSGA